MRTFVSATAAVVTALLAPAPAGAQTSGRPDGMRFVHDARTAFRALTERPDALGFHIDGTPDPANCKHYQAIARVDAADGTPYFLVSRSGNTPNVPGPDDQFCAGQADNGYLIVVRMESRPAHGERLRSNRLAPATVVRDTPPPQSDRATRFFTVVGGVPGHPDPFERPGLVPGEAVGIPGRVYQHPGGMAVVGHMLALALEHPRTPGEVPQTQIMFFDVSNPEAPVFKSQYTPINGNGQVRASAGVVAVTPLPGGLYLMVTAGGANATWFFYRSTVPDLSSEDLSWDFIGSTPSPPTQDAHQTLAFLREYSMSGELYLAGARGHPVYDNRDFIDLYRIRCETRDCAGGEQIAVTASVGGQRIRPFASSGEPGKLGNLAAASGFHVSPSGELLFYATEHDNDGPDGTVRAGEWRNRQVVRDGSPTLKTRIAVSGPLTIDEGGATWLTGLAGPPITKPFIQLFSDPDYTGFSVIADLDDLALERWDDLQDVAQSWNWHAPEGCRGFAADHDGAGVKTLVGRGRIERDRDLTQVANDDGTADMDRKIDAIGFAASGTCRTHYTQPFALRWDLDGDGVFEGFGSPISFSAAAIDGPRVVSVRARAQGVSNGPAVVAATTVTVRNVAPTLTEFRVTDSHGALVNASVPFVLARLPVSVQAAFRDPGLLDHQTATLQWGDGRIEPDTAFESFDEAFGDGAGSAAHTRSYPRAGTFRLRLTVTDDDGGGVAPTALVRVTTPDPAVVEIVGLLDLAIARANPLQRGDLQRARAALTGLDKGTDGALRRIRARDNAAAIGFIDQAIGILRSSGLPDPNVRTSVLLLNQVVAALSLPEPARVAEAALVAAPAPG